MVLLDILQYLPGKLVQMLAVFSGTLTALSDGMNYGWTSPISKILLSATSPIPTTERDIVFLEVIYMVGGLTGLPLTMYLLDKIGRKYTMIVSAAEDLIAWIIIATTSRIELLYVARFLVGFAADVNFIAAPVYIAEICDKDIRGKLGSVIHVMMMIGLLLIYSIGPYVTIATSSAIGASIITIQLITFFFMPESPYYFVINNNEEEARKSLQIFLKSSNVDEKLNEIKKNLENKTETRVKVLDLFRVKSNLKPLLIMTVLNMAQHLSGISVMFMNMHMILEDATSYLTVNTSAIIFSAVMLISSIIAAFTIDAIGRKILLSTSTFFTATSLFIFASYFTVKERGADVTSFNWVPVFAAMLYAFTFKYGLGLVPIILTSELFAIDIKSYAVTVVDFVYTFTSIISIIIFYALQNSFGIDVPFYVFGICCSLTCLFSIFVVPETKRKSLDEIQCLLKKEADTTVNKMNNKHITSNVDNRFN